MFSNTFRLAVVTAIFSILPLANGQDTEKMVLYLVQPRAGRVVKGEKPANLAPILVAVKDAGGVLKGSDGAGSFLLTVTEAKVETLRASRAVLSLSVELPNNWEAVKGLKLSYKREAKPAEEDLKQLSVKLIEDYDRGSFMRVEPIDTEIDAKLIAKLNQCSKLTYITPEFKAKAIRNTKR